MNIDVLISTMNLEDDKELLKKMNVKGNSIIINQITNNKNKEINIEKTTNKVYSFKEKGLSKSRNKAIEKSKAEVCVIADDDLVYEDNYEEIIRDAYKKYPEADIVIFSVKSNDKLYHKKKLKQGKIGYAQSMKVQSVQMTLKRKSIQNKLKFDEDYGTGTTNYMGEENIFLFDALRLGLNIISVPINIATIQDNCSSWFNGYNEEYFKIKSRVFKRMSRKFWLLLVLQFAIRKYNLYKKDISFKDVIKSMLTPGGLK